MDFGCLRSVVVLHTIGGVALSDTRFTIKLTHGLAQLAAFCNVDYSQSAHMALLMLNIVKC